jgi:hypothetical protein
MHARLNALICCGLAALAAAAWLANLPLAKAAEDAPAAPATDAKARSTFQPSASKAGQRAREGSLVSDETGSFEFVGERIIFVPGGGRESLRVLENLALERIVRELGDARDQRNWVISGVLTEFKGANYLLVTKAMLAVPAGAVPQASLPAPAAGPREAAQAEGGGEVANSGPLR